LDGLAGQELVMYEAQPGGTSIANPMARGRFRMDGDVLKLDYTTKSPSDVFEYTCKTKDDKVICRDERNLLGWCAALEGHEAGSCTKSRLRSLGAKHETDEELLEVMHTAHDARVEAERAGAGAVFSMVNNNLGNKLQSVVYVEVLEASCQYVLTDNYRALYNARWVEDSNVVGTNPFTSGEGEYLWETCTDVQSLVGTTSAERPAAPPAPEAHDVGEQMHYHYMGETATQPEDGCTYTADTYAQWRPLEKGRAIAAGEDGRLDWDSGYAWPDLAPLKMANPASPTGIYSLLRYKKCGDAEPELIDTVCTATFFNGGVGAPAPADGEAPAPGADD